MLGNLIRAFKGGASGGKAITVLNKTYSLSISHPDHMQLMKRISSSFGELYNEHEMAVHFLSEFVKLIKQDHPQAKSEVEKYIKMAKGAKARGLVESEVPLELLYESVLESFNINHNDIKAA